MKKITYFMAALVLLLISTLPAQSGESVKKTRIGLYGIGLDTYWGQFEGLHDRLQGYQKQIAERMSAIHGSVEVINTGIVDTPEKARRTGRFLAEKNVDAIFLYISTYALSSTVLPVVQAVDVPVIVLSLQPTPAIDYKWFNALGDRGRMTGEWLAYCQACSAPEIASVFNRAEIDYHLITGTLEDEAAWLEIEEWVEAINLAAELRDTNIGLLGHYYGGMLDVYSDVTKLASVFGTHFEILEMSTLYRYSRETTNKQISSMEKQFQDNFIVDPGCQSKALLRAARTAAALDKLVTSHKLGALAYYYGGSDDERYEAITTSVIPGNTLLTKKGVPVAGEYEIKNVIAMKILDLMGRGGSFSEFYAMDLNDDIVMLGHDGPGHAGIAEGKVRLVPLPVFHGKPGEGLSIQMRVKEGPVTMLSVVQEPDGSVKLLAAEGKMCGRSCTRYWKYQ